MSIRTKILLGFLILVLMLFISGALSLFELHKLGGAVKGLITDNYQSINYSRQMLEALEQQEKVLLEFTGSGNPSPKAEFIKHMRVIELSLDSARLNLTEDSEVSCLDSIETVYGFFYSGSIRYFEGANPNMEFFVEQLHPAYLRSAHHIKQLMLLNQKALYNTAAFLEGSSQRVAMPGLIVIVTSIIFTLVFVYLVNHFFVSPIIRITRGIDDFIKFKKPFDVPIETKDELRTLRESVSRLISHYRSGSNPKEKL